MNGRKPHATQRRRLAGNPGKRPYNEQEPTPPGVTPANDTPPSSLDGDTRAIVEWVRLAPILRKAKMISEADLNALAAYCQQWSIYQDALTKCGPETRVFKSPSGYPCINPFLAIANKALMMCIRLGEQLGMTPGGRSRVSATGGPDDPFAEFDLPVAPRKGVIHAPSDGVN